MKVVLVNPPQPGLVDPYTYPPVGLAHLRAAVERDCPDVHCRILNLAGSTVQGAAHAIRETEPDVVGYTATTTYWNEVKAVGAAVRAIVPEAVQIIGGPHPTLTGESAECFATAFIGPAEGSMVRFLAELKAGANHRIYFPEPCEHAVPSPEDVLGGHLHAASHERTAVVFSSFGCTNNCSFCAARGMYRKVMVRDTDEVVSELEGIVAHGIYDVRFMDDTFAIAPGRVAELCGAMAGMGLRWGCVMRVDQARSDTLAAMKRAGCVEVGLGCESFDQAVLNAIGKKTVVAQNIGAVRAVHDAGMDVHMFLMISTPGETPETVDRNIDALEPLRSCFTRLLLSTLMPYPGSAIHRNPARFGALLLEPDPTHYNQHQYHGRDAAEAMVWSPLLFDGLERDTQLDNIARMREYAGNLHQVNRGRFGVAHEPDCGGTRAVV